MKPQQTLLLAGLLVLPLPGMTAEFMDAAWAKQACAAWNADPVLTTQLMALPADDGKGYSWISNDAGRGYKLVQMYRTQCGEATKIQLNIVAQGGKAVCNYGGVADGINPVNIYQINCILS